MNLRQNPQETKNTSHSGSGGVSPWYRQPETVTLPEAATSPAVSAVASLSSTVAADALYEPAAAERILARAGALQEVHRQMLSREQIEAVAAELDIRPEFVQRAIEQKNAGTLSQPRPLISTEAEVARLRTRLRIVSTLIACGVILAAFTAVAALPKLEGDIPRFLILFLFPFLLSLTLGFLGRSRRWAAASGVALAAVVIAGSLWCVFPFRVPGNTEIEPFAVKIYTSVIVLSVIFAVAGAQARRVVEKRQVTNRSRRAARAQRP